MMPDMKYISWRGIAPVNSPCRNLIVDLILTACIFMLHMDVDCGIFYHW